MKLKQPWFGVIILILAKVPRVYRPNQVGIPALGVKLFYLPEARSQPILVVKPTNSGR